MTATTEHVPAGTLLQVDPATLVLDENIRTDAQLDDAFVASIEANGVRVALEVREDPLGQLLIVDGQRRYLAAMKTAKATVPVIIATDISDDGDRITNQWILNEHRTSLTPAERAAAVGQLSLFGRSPAAIAKKLGTTREEVDAALVVAEAPKMLEVVAAEPELDLVTAAKLAEFADDADVLEELTACALDDPGDLEHEMQLHRQDRAVAKAEADLRAQLNAAGVRLVASADGRAIGGLAAVSNDEHGGMAPPLTPEQHAECAHRAVWLNAYWAAGGPDVAQNEVCMDPEAAGHHFRFRSPSSTTTEEVDEEALAAQKSAERRHVIAQNAASDAAQEVRRRFITDHLLWERDPRGRMTKVPEGAVQHIAAMIEAAPNSVSGYEAGNLLSEWAKGKTTPPPGSSRPVAERALLRRVLAAGEASLLRDFWRQVPQAYYYAGIGAGPLAVKHLRQLETWGYGLAPVEREYLAAWDAAVTKHNEAEARRATERAERDAEVVTP